MLLNNSNIPVINGSKQTNETINLKMISFDSKLDEVVEIDAGEVEENGLPNDSELDATKIETEAESNLIKDYFSKQGEGTTVKITLPIKK